MLVKRSLLFILFFMILVNCGMPHKSLIIPESKYDANFDSMFDAAIKAGAELEYHPEYQDKKTGLIKMLQNVGGMKYRIIVKFVKSEEKAEVVVSGDVEGDIVNPFITGHVKKIEKAIINASGI